MIIWATLARPVVKTHLAVTAPGESYHLTTLPAPLVTAALSVAASRIISGSPVMVFNIPQVANLVYPGSLQFEGKMLNNYPVQRTDFRLVRGVTNEIIFFVRDIDRKPVVMAVDDSLTINIVDTRNDTLLMSRDLTAWDLAKGIYQFATLPSEMDTWPSGPLRWSMAFNRGGIDTVMLWTDQTYSPYSSLVIIESPTPGPAPTISFLWADMSVLIDGLYYSSSLPGAAQDGYVNGIQTFVLALDDFTGTVRYDGSLVAQPDPSVSSPDWIELLSEDFDAVTETHVTNLLGNYLWLRMVVTLVDGTITRVDYKV